MERRPESDSDKIVAYILYGDSPLFILGAIRAAHQVPLLLPGWKVRFYIDETVPKETASRLAALGAEIILVQDEMASYGEARRIWRYRAIDDDRVNYVLFRDIDSVISVRELIAIKAWLDSGIPFHAMHDHPFHNVPILGGMWSAHAPTLRNLTNVTESMRQFVATNNWIWKQTDQDWLAEKIFPVIRNQTRFHDSFICEIFAKSVPFPAARDANGEYVGKVVEVDYAETSEYHKHGLQRFEGHVAPEACRLDPSHSFG